MFVTFKSPVEKLPSPITYKLYFWYFANMYVNMRNGKYMQNKMYVNERKLYQLANPMQTKIRRSKISRTQTSYLRPGGLLNVLVRSVFVSKTKIESP